MDNFCLILKKNIEKQKLENEGKISIVYEKLLKTVMPYNNDYDNLWKPDHINGNLHLLIKHYFC